ncbi:PAQR family membrane homeostasis protein TrhA [Bdellovibrio sp. HCB337]|uniref:PAQR family membrane homeostasis protein TrhA n=1 Tax=Bdellovibrio sp. HCB337 TaxID=3394358 RepID=UPI0039A57F31
MADEQVPAIVKPLLRGHFHQAAFFFAMGACAMLIARSDNSREAIATVIYSLGVVGLFGISALYHRPMWNPRPRATMKRLDHAAIFVMIAGTGTPLTLLAMQEGSGNKLLIIFWAAAFVGIIQSIFWVKAPKLLSAILYVIMGWLAVPYLPELQAALGTTSVVLLLVGGVIYTLGALVYAFKWPNPWPRVFGYHEIFHIMVIVAAVFHFIVIASLMR